MESESRRRWVALQMKLRTTNSEQVFTVAISSTNSTKFVPFVLAVVAGVISAGIYSILT